MDERNSSRSPIPESDAPLRTSYSRPRKHMGVATNDPEYLPPVDNPRFSARTSSQTDDTAHGPSHPGGPLRGSARGGASQGQGYIPPSSSTLKVRPRDRGAAGGPAVGGAPGGKQLHYDRYISVPKKGKTIFTSRQARQHRNTQILLVVLILAAIALALVWFFLLR